MRATSPSSSTRGCTGCTSRPRAWAISDSTEEKSLSCSRCLIVGKTSSISPARLASSAPLGVNQPRSTHSWPSTRGLLARRQEREEEVRVEADLHLGGGDPARELDERVRVLEGDRRLLAQLADRGHAVCRVAVALLCVDGAAGEHPHAPHEARLGRAPDEQQFELRVSTAEQDHARSLARGGGWAGVVRLARSRALAVLWRAHRLTLPAANLWRMTDTTASPRKGDTPRT